MKCLSQLSAMLGAGAVAVLACAGEPAPASGPTYLDLARAYADVMIEKGRDTYGKEHSPLFAATLDRETYEVGKQPGIPGVRGKDRCVFGANVQDDPGLYHLLLGLAEVTGDPKYQKAYDECFAFFYTKTQSPVTGLYPWGEHICWNFVEDRCTGWKMMHEANMIWPFWDDAYRMAPENAWRYAVGMLDHGIIVNEAGGIAQFRNKVTFSRHTQYDKHNPWQGSEYPRYGGQFMWIFADAYGRPENRQRERRDDLKRAAEQVLEHYETKLRNCGYIPCAGGPDGTKYYGKGRGVSSGIRDGSDRGEAGLPVKRMPAWPGQSLELARCAWFAAQAFDEPLKSRFRDHALAVEDTFFTRSERNPIQHKVFEGGGFHANMESTLEGPNESYEKGRKANSWTPHWQTRYGSTTTASMACDWMIPRYLQIKDTHPQIARKYMAMFEAVADIYMTADPEPGMTLTPGSLEPVVRFMGQMYEWTGERKYLERANHFAQLAVWHFMDGVSPLPRASTKNDHYESKTRSAELMNTLFELHRWGIRPDWNYPSRVGLDMGPDYVRADRPARVRMLLDHAAAHPDDREAVEEVMFRMPGPAIDGALKQALPDDDVAALAARVLERRAAGAAGRDSG